MLWNNLLQNERAKIYKKPSTWVLLGITVLLTVAQILFAINQQHIAVLDALSQTEDDQWASHYQDEILDNKQMLEEMQLLEFQNYLKKNIAYKTQALKWNIAPTDWRMDLVMEYAVAQVQMQDMLAGQNDESERIRASADYLALQQQLDRLATKVQKNDWRAHMREKIQAVQEKTGKTLNTQEQKIYTEIYQYYLDKNIVPLPDAQKNNALLGISTLDMTSKVDRFWKDHELQQLLQNRLDRLHNEMVDRDGTIQMLTRMQQKKYEQAIALSEMRLETDTPPIELDSAPGIMSAELSLLPLLSLLPILVAAGIMSSEFNSGTIKLLLISPHRRKTIYWAKAALLGEILLGSLLVLFVSSLLTVGVWYGFKGMGTMSIVMLFGQAARMPEWAYVVLKSLLNLIPCITFTALAFMLSTVTRKSALSMVIPLLLLYGFSMVPGILADSGKTALPGIKFCLFANTNFNGFFASELVSDYFGLHLLRSAVADNSMTLGFSIMVLLAYTVCFLWIGRDSFCYRDV